MMDWFVITGWLFVTLFAFNALSCVLRVVLKRSHTSTPKVAAVDAIAYVVLVVWIIVALGRV